MTDSKHTPGPWEAIKPQPAKGFNCWWLMAGSMGLGTISGYEGDAEREANARLIAAAPDLLEALKGLLAYLEDGIGDHDSGEGASARAAIAKAEGNDDATC